MNVNEFKSIIIIDGNSFQYDMKSKFWHFTFVKL